MHDGKRFEWDPTDYRSAPNKLVIYGDYEPVETKILLTIAKRSRTILDVGANAGWYSVKHIRNASESTMVHAFEPVESTFKRLAHNVDLNNLGPKIKVNQFGLSNKAQEVEFYLPAVSGSSAASMKELHADELNTRVMCELKTSMNIPKRSLDSVDLIKIDVEGAELLTIQGGINTIRGNTPIIFAKLLRKWQNLTVTTLTMFWNSSKTADFRAGQSENPGYVKSMKSPIKRSKPTICSPARKNIMMC